MYNGPSLATMPGAVRVFGPVNVNVANNTATPVLLATASGDVSLLGTLVRSRGATTVDLSSISVKGGNSDNQLIIDTTNGDRANLDVLGKQVGTEASAVGILIADGEEVNMYLDGSSGTLVDFDVYLVYRKWAYNSELT